MMKIKRFILSLLFTKEERILIWNSVRFSKHTYKRRHDEAGAGVMEELMIKTKKIFFSEKESYSEEELNKMVNDIVQRWLEDTEFIS